MARYKNILVATDFSPEMDKVLDQAVEIARQDNAALTVLHVVEHINTVYADEYSFPEIPDTEKLLMERAETEMQKIQENLQIPESECIVRSGWPKHEIIDLAKQKGVDLIVVGSHGRHGLQLLLGSTANGVLHLASCDVLAVRMG